MSHMYMDLLGLTKYKKGLYGVQNKISSGAYTGFYVVRGGLDTLREGGKGVRLGKLFAEHEACSVHSDIFF